jgi:hypothetical protein
MRLLKNVFCLGILISSVSVLTSNAAADIVISGTVRDQATSLPVQGATITLQAQGIVAVSDINGTYSLVIPDLVEAVIVAAKKGYYNQSEFFEGDPLNFDINLPMVPHQDDPSYEFMSPESCAGCHPNQYDRWVGSPMADAGLNTWVHDIYNGTGTPTGMGGFVYTRDSTFSATNPNSECASCHQPEPWIQTPFSRMQNPTDPGYPSSGVVHGISCETCHKIADVDVNKINFPGVFPGAVEYVRPQGPSFFDQVQFGLLGDVDFTIPGVMQASYNPQLAAETCAACHQDAADPDENHSYNGVISEPTYLEWVNSAYGDPNSEHFATCLDCHMLATDDADVCTVIDLGRDPNTVRDHRILGSTPEFLENAAELTVESTVGGGILEVDVAVANLYTGHHLPTGVTVRNMILLVEAWNETTGEPLEFMGDQTVHDLGGLGDPALGYYAGLPGRFFAKVNHDASGVGPTFFTDAVGITFDNRIPALQTDESTYTFSVPTNEPVRVRARLIYRRAFRFLVDAKQWTEDGHGQPLADVAGPDYGHLMESSDTTFSICRADFTGNGMLDIFDLFEFINAFNAKSPIADLTGNGVYDIFDVFAFIESFNLGCP